MQPADLGHDPPRLQWVDGPWRAGSELRWNVRHEGQPAVLGQLVTELARDPSVRRRYVRDIERLHALDVPGMAPIVAIGPQPDPRDPDAAAPWRLRLQRGSQTLEQWLDRRSPAPVDEACALVASLADIVDRVHATGAVLRDLHPRNIRLDPDSTPWLTDVGLSRVDVLSSRTAASLILEGSVYASPEQLQRTAVDGRSDVYALGVMLFVALTGVPPFEEATPLFRTPGPPPRPRSLRPSVVTYVDDLCARCLQSDPAARPESARSLAAALRGEITLPEHSLARVGCHACGAPLRPGQRLCLGCGRLAVQFEHAPIARTRQAVALRLRKVDERADAMASLRNFLDSVAQGPLPRLNFLVGDARMYSEEERARLIKLPARLFDNLQPDTARRLDARFKSMGFSTEVVPMVRRGVPRSTKIGAAAVLSAGMAAAGFMLLTGVPWPIVVMVPIVAALIAAAIAAAGTRRPEAPQALLRLREAPAALPASDPLVRRLADQLDSTVADDVRDLVGELALLVQRLVDHRVEHATEQTEIDAVTEPIGALVDLVARQVGRLRQIDRDLRQLDEGTLVRALAASEARGEPAAARSALLDGLDRLRTLEEERARGFHRLLEASALIRRSIELGLQVRDEQAEHDRQVQLALRALDPGDDGPLEPRAAIAHRTG